MPPTVPVALSLSGIRPPDGSEDPRALIDWAAGLNPRHLQLDATATGLRPRDLDRSARRDLASILRRRQICLAGIDAFIPPRHLVEPATIDRAVAAILGAIELAADLDATKNAAPHGRAVVAIESPAGIATDVLMQFAAAAARLGITIADHRRTPRPADSTSDAANPEPESTIGIGIDPAVILAAGEDVFDTVARLRAAPAQARLSDHDGAARVPPGSPTGRLDLASYAAALSSVRYTRPVVADLRAIHRPALAAPRILAAWNDAVSITGAG